MAARNMQDTQSVEALKKELDQLERRLQKAREDQEKNSETLVNKLRRGLEAARKKERAARDQLAQVRARKKTSAQERQLEQSRKNLADARARIQAITREAAEARQAHQGFKADNKRAAARAQEIAKHTRDYEKKTAKRGKASKPSATKGES